MNANLPTTSSEKTAILFPGLDAIFSSARMKMWLENPVIQSTLKEASETLAKITGEPEDLAAFIRSHKYLHLVDFDRTLVALTCLQVGIARQIREPWDLAQGCSHGDIARAVITESFSFKESIELLWIFAFLRKSTPDGYTANVRMRDGSALPEEILTNLKNRGMPVSLWSHTNGTIGGSTEALELLSAEAEAWGLKVKPVLRFPVHSPIMQPSMQALDQMTRHYQLQPPSRPVFSSVWVKFLTTGEEVRAEALAGSVNEVRWMETLAHLHQHENVTCFINVGPSNTLTGWLFEHPKFQELRLLDGWDLVSGAGS